jgi:hypothetical protein
MSRLLLAAVLAVGGFACARATTPDAKETASPFGVSASAQSTYVLGDWLGDVSHLGVGWLRGFDTFDRIEPKEGVWQWKDVDMILRAAAENHVKVSGLFFYGNSWIPSPSRMPTTNLPAWSKYVATVVKHVDGKVKYWEAWNEPPNFTENATPADYAALVRATYDAAHGADPTCRVGLCAQSVNLNYLDQALQAGAADHFDYVALHPYESLNCVDDGFEGEFMSIVPTVRKMLAARDPAKANVPVWFTEIGTSIGQMNGKVKVTPELQAEALIKAYTMALAQGVTRIDWFEGRDGDSGPMGLFTAQHNARPAAAAMQMMIEALGRHPVYEGWELLNARDYAFIFQGREGTVMIAWAPPRLTDELLVGDGVEATNPEADDDLRGGTVNLTNAPVVITGKIPRSFVEIANANAGKPFPWGGDFSQATSVSIALGSPNVAKGLHLLFADATSRPVMIDGTPARDCSGAAAQSFTVDPNFLSYTSVPIVISAVVRRDAAGDDAGFDLKYESVSGWKTADAWSAIPAGKQWTTLTWTITDDQFVGKWGFNFTLDSETTAKSRYALKSVSVEKK